MEPANSNVNFHEADLTKGMEHLRPYVSVAVAPRQPITTHATSPHRRNEQPDNGDCGDTSTTYGVPNSIIQPARRPAARTMSPSSNPQKRTDPFQFGSRYLEEGDDIFEFNAWDHVEVDDAYRDFAAAQYERQRSEPVADVDKLRYNVDPAKWWDRFYTNNRTKFFKNRKWLFQEFPRLQAATAEGSPPVVILEVGAGAGNTAFPILQENRNSHLKIHACDYSAKAIDLIRTHEMYDDKFIQANVWDVTGTEHQSLPPGVASESVDIVILIFIFSALAPEQWTQALWNIWNLLKPGGEVLFRDYGRGDLAQVRFKKGRYLEDNFYIRGDGTRVYFFDKDQLDNLWQGELESKDPEDSNGTPELEVGLNQHTETALQDISENQRPKFQILNLGVDRRMLVNRQRKLKMYRCWMQGHFRKPDGKENLVLVHDRTPQ